MKPAFRLASFALSIAFFFAACTSRQPAATEPSVVAAVDTPVPTAIVQPTPVLPDLKVLDTAGWHREAGNVIFEGDVQNQSDRSLRNISALVTYYTQDLQRVKQIDGPIATDPLAAGETAHFAITSSDDPSITQATIEFRGPGGTISTQEG
ncbi:MAG: hypothetical protein QOF51_1717 [Chloroflexota bacterium]|nr:hypothetical protein [Chloroflexota bacterium]